MKLRYSVWLRHISCVDEKIDAEVHHIVDFILLPVPEGEACNQQHPDNNGRNPEDEERHDRRGLLGQGVSRGCG